MNRLWPALLPELHRFPATEQGEALRAARHAEFDVIEWFGMATALVAVTALTRYTLHDAMASTRSAAVALDFVVALPLLVVALGPFHLRRLRRGLREQLQRQPRP